MSSQTAQLLEQTGFVEVSKLRLGGTPFNRRVREGDAGTYGIGGGWAIAVLPDRKVFAMPYSTPSAKVQDVLSRSCKKGRIAIAFEEGHADQLRDHYEETCTQAEKQRN